MHKIQYNVAKVLARIQKSTDSSHITAKNDHCNTLLIAASKTRSANSIRSVFECGIHDFGENYCQEALEKMELLKDLAITWHFIGPIQSNKTKLIAENFHWAHSIDKFKTAKRLSDQRPKRLPPLQLCLQVNISKEKSKSGFCLEELTSCIAKIAVLPNITLRGLMCIPAKGSDFNQQRQPFASLAAILKESNLLISQHYLTSSAIIPAMDTLSMGMSSDMEAAIAEGATHVRIGTDIFGERETTN